MPDESTDQNVEQLAGHDDGEAVDVTSFNPPDPDAAILAKADNPDAVKKALQAERAAVKRAKDEAAALAAKLKEIEDAAKSEDEKRAERLAELEAKLSPLEQENLRLRVAHEKNLPAELVDRLRGDDREALEADADALLALVVAKTPDSRGSADQGARTGGNKQLSREDLQKMTPEQINEAREQGRTDHLLGRV